MHNRIYTTRFKMSHFAMFVRLMRIVAGRWLLLPLVMIVVSIAMAFIVDLKYVIVALMILMILVPMMVAFLYIYYGLASGCWQNIVEKELEVVDLGINVDMFIYPKRDATQESELESTDEVESIAKIEETIESEVDVVCRNRLIAWREIKYIKESSKNIVIYLYDKPLGFLIIPKDYISDHERFVDVVKSKIATLQ